MPLSIGDALYLLRIAANAANGAADSLIAQNEAQRAAAQASQLVPASDAVLRRIGNGQAQMQTPASDAEKAQKAVEYHAGVVRGNMQTLANVVAQIVAGVGGGQEKQE